MELEQTLFVHKEVDLFKIPPRQGAGGHRSGDWRVADKIFTARLKVIARGETLEVRLEDPNSGELFGVCPVPRGQLHIAVESATDSSRNFVLRLEDAATRRHAFLGMSFGDRSAAFDFNVALTDHEKRLQREAEFSRIAAAPDPLAAAQQVLPEAATLYKHQDLSLKEGETIRIAVKKPGSSGGGAEAGGGFLSRMPQPVGSTPGSGGAKLMPLAPPPADLSAGPRLAPPPATHSNPHPPRTAAVTAAAVPARAAAPLVDDPFASFSGAGGSITIGAVHNSTPASVRPASGGVDLLGLDPFVPSMHSSSGGSSSSSTPGMQSTVAAFDNFQPFAATAGKQQQQAAAAKPAPQPAAEPGWATFE